MKKLIAPIFAMIIGIFSMGAFAETGALKKVEPQYVCMVNNKLFDKVQIPISVDGKTYYGCCPMCKEKLEKSADARSATDPVSNKRVDKATAVIGAETDGTVHYFENETNLNRYKKQ